MTRSAYAYPLRQWSSAGNLSASVFCSSCHDPLAAKVAHLVFTTRSKHQSPDHVTRNNDRHAVTSGTVLDQGATVSTLRRRQSTVAQPVFHLGVQRFYTRGVV
jgi:hypothetical protein